MREFKSLYNFVTHELNVQPAGRIFDWSTIRNKIFSKLQMDNKPIISKKLIWTDRVNIGALEPILNKINLRIQELDQSNSAEPDISQSANFSSDIECLEGNVLIEP